MERIGEIKAVLFLLFLAGAAAADLSEGKIPNRLLLCFFSVGVLIHLMGNGGTARWILCAETAFLAVLYGLWKKGLAGGGDVKLFAAVIFWYPGGTGALMVAGSFLTAAVFFAVRLPFSRKRRFPMAPFVFVSAAAAILFQAAGRSGV